MVVASKSIVRVRLIGVGAVTTGYTFGSCRSFGAFDWGLLDPCYALYAISRIVNLPIMCLIIFMYKPPCHHGCVCAEMTHMILSNNVQLQPLATYNPNAGRD